MADEDEKGGFGVSRRIMLTSIFSLFAVVILIVLLHLYSRYLQRRQERRRRAAIDRLTSEIAPHVANFFSGERLPKVGLDPMVLASIPAFKYNQTDQIGRSGDGVECSVCLSTIVEDTMVRELPNCKHLFHVECIDMWLGSHTTCPICRTLAEPRVPTAVETVAPQPSAPPLQEEAAQRNGPEIEKGSGSSGSRFGSFRWMVSRDRSSRARSCEDEICVQDLERQ